MTMIRGAVTLICAASAAACVTMADAPGPLAGYVDPAPTEPSAEAIAAMAALQPLMGAWTATSSDETEEGTAVGPAGVSQFAAMHEGAMVREVARIPGAKFNLTIENVFSYDQFAQVYRVASMDKELGLVSVFEGALGEARLDVNDLRHMPDAPANWRLVWEWTDPDAPTLTVYASDDGGAAWTSESVVRYTRATP